MANIFETRMSQNYGNSKRSFHPKCGHSKKRIAFFRFIFDLIANCRKMEFISYITKESPPQIIQ